MRFIKFRPKLFQFYIDAPVGTEYYYTVTYNGQYEAHLKVTKIEDWEQVEAFYIAHILSDENATKKNLQIAFDRVYKNVRIISPEEISEVRIFDMSGKEVRKKTTENVTKETSISTMGLPKGAYFAMVNLKYSQKFLVE